MTQSRKKTLCAAERDYPHRSLIEPWNVFFLGAETKEDLENLPAARVIPHKDGVVWVVYPRGRKDMRKSDVMAAGKFAVLTDNKVARFSDTHTAIRFVVPLAQR